ncbi:MAG: DivIVA domain-containing protein [Actinobacteria bacterium]|nr:DivIVA domain-containing protein [Actinomycetota bacterium]MCB9412313.1 DivIVA domain-containing protein [Actinomycetota bacterium]
MSYSARGASPGPHRRPISASEVRSVVFTTTRMRLGYDVEEVDAFLDHVEWSMEQMVAEIGRLQRQLGDIDRANAARLEQARLTAQQLVALLGGTPGNVRPPSWGQPAITPSGPQFQPRRAAPATPPGWNPAAPPPPPPGAGSVVNSPNPVAPGTPPPPTGRPAANLPPPSAAQAWGFPPPRG